MKIWQVGYFDYDGSVCYGFYSTFEKAEARRQALVKANREFWTSAGMSYTEGGRDEKFDILEHTVDVDTEEKC